ncbi:MAG: transposase [Salibacteraceae bacterium]
MKNTDVVYIGIDLHSNTSTIGYMNELGEYCGHRQVQTTSRNLINQVTAIPGKVKKLTLEQSNMAFWASELLQEVVDELMVCDPRQNTLISRGENKNDGLDTLALCRLLRLGQLKEVWRPKQMGLRRLFFHQVKEYHRLVKTMSIHKRQLGDGLRHWGINIKLTKADYQRPEKVLSQVNNELLRQEFCQKMQMVALLIRRKDLQKKNMQSTAKAFDEITEYKKMPGIGPVGACTFSGYIQNPHRFSRAGQLIKFCKLSVRHFTSDGKKVRNPRLSKAGHGVLKNLAHVAWKTNLHSDNEIDRYYLQQLDRCGNPVHARLATQRKILITMWALWKNKTHYDPNRFTYNGRGGSTR